MARPRKQTVDYFPHTITTNSRTLFVLETKYGNDGYAFWFKLLEILGSTNGHSFNAADQTDLIFLSAKVKLEEFKVLEILDLLASLDAIDKELWDAHKVIWCQNFVDNLTDLYAKRKVSAPEKPVFEEFPERKPELSGVSGVGNPQSKLNKSKVKESKEKESKDNEQMIAQVWSRYPNKKGKATAIKKLPKLIKTYGYEQLIRCIERYEQTSNFKNGYVKQGDTFFNTGYVDYLDENYQEEGHNGECTGSTRSNKGTNSKGYNFSKMYE